MPTRAARCEQRRAADGSVGLSLTDASRAEILEILRGSADFRADPLIAACAWRTLVENFPPQEWAPCLAGLRSVGLGAESRRPASSAPVARVEDLLGDAAFLEAAMGRALLRALRGSLAGLSRPRSFVEPILAMLDDAELWKDAVRCLEHLELDEAAGARLAAALRRHRARGRDALTVLEAMGSIDAREGAHVDLCREVLADASRRNVLVVAEAVAVLGGAGALTSADIPEIIRVFCGYGRRIPVARVLAARMGSVFLSVARGEAVSRLLEAEQQERARSSFPALALGAIAQLEPALVRPHRREIQKRIDAGSEHDTYPLQLILQQLDR